MKPLISSEHLSKLIDQCKDDLKNGLGNKIYEVAGVLQAVAQANNDPVFYVIPQAVGGFGQQLISSRALTFVPVLPPETRTKLNSAVSNAVEAACESMETIKKELCQSEDIDHQALMNAIGQLYKHATILAGQRGALTPSRMPSRREEEEE